MNDYELETKMRMYRAPVRPQYKRKKYIKPKKSAPKFLIFICFIVTLVCVGVLCFNKLNFDIGKEKSMQTALDSNFHFSPRRQNILLMGVDEATNGANPFKGNRTDTMLIISIAPLGKNVNVISIPRDSKVYISGRAKADKINHAFAFGGAKGAVDTVEDTFGIKINHYIAISNKGVIQLIDTLGGLPIFVEKDMKYTDHSAKLYIDLKKGNQVLSGRQTEGYLRFRHDSYGDIGRIRRQQWFFNALLSRLKEPSVITKLPELLQVMPQYIQTDMSVHDLAKYAALAKNIDTSSVQIATIPGTPSTKGVISYWIINPDKTQDLINKMIYRNKSDTNIYDVSIGIMYTNAKMTKALNLKKELTELGFTNVSLQQASHLSKNYIAVHNLDVAGDVVNEFKKIVPQLKDEHTIYDPVGINRAGKDFTIVISDSQD